MRAHQILIDNKVHAGRVGFDGRHAVERSTTAAPCWSIAAGSRAGRHAPMLPSRRRRRASSRCSGRIDVPPAGYLELGDRAPPSGPLWQHLDPQRFAQATGLAVLPIVVDALEMPVDDGLVHDFPLPETGVGNT